MGEIADMMIDGTLDFYTGEYIGKGYGLPRTFDKSLPWEKKKINFRNRGKRFKQTNFSQNQGINGVVFWLYDKGITNSENAHSIVKLYSEINGWEITKKKMVSKICAKIQEDFPAFIKWYNENKERI